MTRGQRGQSAYFERSSHRIAEEAEESFQKGEYDRVVRKVQESVELHLKSLLLAEGIEPEFFLFEGFLDIFEDLK